MVFDLVKGTKEYFGKEQEERELILFRLINLFKRYGFKPLETPILQRLETLTAKYSGEEIVKEIFKLKDLGNRDLGLRFDLTVPLARFVKDHLELRFPLKRYEYGKVFRNGPVKTGRLREFMQCDIDIIGSSSIYEEIELLNLASRFFRELGLDVVIKINDIRLIREILRINNVDEKDMNSVILTIDKLEKIGEGNVVKELRDKGIENGKEIIEMCRKSIDELKTLNESIKSIINDLEIIKENVDGEIVIDPSLARGLSYYTSTIFEIYTRDDKYKNSISGGGRYDKMIGLFSDKVIPAVGISFGIDSIIAALNVLGINKEKERKGIFIKPLKGLEDYAISIAEKLREKTDCFIDFSEKSLKAAMRMADNENYRYVCIIGEKEKEKGLLNIKDLEKSESLELNINEFLELIKK